MSYLDTPGIDILFPKPEIIGPEAIKEEPKLKTPLEVLRPELPKEIVNHAPVEWNGIADVPRDREGIAQNRDWILADGDKRWAPGPGEYSPYEKIPDDVVAQLRKKTNSPPSSWVRFAMAELERTGMRRAIPSGFGPRGGESDLEKENTIYVGVPNE